MNLFKNSSFTQKIKQHFWKDHSFDLIVFIDQNFIHCVVCVPYIFCYLCFTWANSDCTQSETFELHVPQLVCSPDLCEMEMSYLVQQESENLNMQTESRMCLLLSLCLYEPLTDPCNCLIHFLRKEKDKVEHGQGHHTSSFWRRHQWRSWLIWCPRRDDEKTLSIYLCARCVSLVVLF